MSKERFQFDAAGWGFWSIVFVILLAPSVWGMWHIVYEAQRNGVVIAAGVAVAALGAGIVSCIVNALLQRVQQRQRQSERKKTKKQRG